jgi:hypothetical protein
MPDAGDLAKYNEVSVRVSYKSASISPALVSKRGVHRMQSARICRAPPGSNFRWRCETCEIWMGLAAAATTTNNAPQNGRSPTVH